MCVNVRKVIVNFIASVVLFGNVCAWNGSLDQYIETGTALLRGVCSFTDATYKDDPSLKANAMRLFSQCVRSINGLLVINHMGKDATPEDWSADVLFVFYNTLEAFKSLGNILVQKNDNFDVATKTLKTNDIRSENDQKKKWYSISTYGQITQKIRLYVLPALEALAATFLAVGDGPETGWYHVYAHPLLSLVRLGTQWVDAQTLFEQKFWIVALIGYVMSGVMFRLANVPTINVLWEKIQDYLTYTYQDHSTYTYKKSQDSPVVQQAYKTLGLRSSATEEEIKKQFKKLARVHHPDKGGDDDHMGQLLKARDILLGRDIDEDLKLMRVNYENTMEAHRYHMNKWKNDILENENTFRYQLLNFIQQLINSWAFLWSRICGI